MKINKKKFLEWLSAQPDSRTWDYCDISECVGASFCREALGKNTIWSSMEFRREGDEIYFPIPKWLEDALRVQTERSRLIKARALKSYFRAKA